MGPKANEESVNLGQRSEQYLVQQKSHAPFFEGVDVSSNIDGVCRKPKPKIIMKRNRIGNCDDFYMRLFINRPMAKGKYQ
jgi:hypothetical protein